ncbi:hypothetical protein MKW92_011361, partial [Papaver armeniacum]
PPSSGKATPLLDVYPDLKSGNSLIHSTSPTPHVSQATGAMSCSILVSQQPVPVFRQPQGLHMPSFSSKLPSIRLILFTLFCVASHNSPILEQQCISPTTSQAAVCIHFLLQLQISNTLFHNSNLEALQETQPT